MHFGGRAAISASIVALLVAALALAPAASANGGPRMKAYDYTVAFLGAFGEEDDYFWRQGVTICSSRAARIRLRHEVGNATEPHSIGFVTWYLNKRRAGCKRYRLTFDRNTFAVRSRVILSWRALRVVGPWRVATCEPRCP